MTCLPCSCFFVTFCSLVDVSLLLASAFARKRWIASITSGCWARTASPSFCVQSSFVLIIARTSGVATNDFTLSSQALLVNRGFQFVAFEILVFCCPTVGLHYLKRIGRGHQDQ